MGQNSMAWITAVLQNTEYFTWFANGMCTFYILMEVGNVFILKCRYSIQHIYVNGTRSFFHKGGGGTFEGATQAGKSLPCGAEKRPWVSIAWVW